MVRNDRTKALIIHIIVWASFIFYEVTIALLMGSKAKFIDFAAFYVLAICLFYFNSDVVFRFSENLKRITLILVPLVLIELATYTVLSLCIGLFIFKSQSGWDTGKIVNDDIVRALWRGIYFIGLSTGYWFFKRTIAVTKEANRLRILQLESERSKVEMEKNLALSKTDFLRAQINPHFLFNTLNYIYNSTEKVSPEASQGILLLSEIMRYALSDTAADGKVPLDDEIAHIQRYITLTQLRFGNALFVSFKTEIAEGCRECRVPPLLLLTFVENIFKHGDLNDPGKPATININCEQQVLHLVTENAKRESKAPSDRHIGIINAQTRLNLHYSKEAFDLSLSDTLTRFIVDLRIKL